MVQVISLMRFIDTESYPTVFTNTITSAELVSGRCSHATGSHLALTD